MNKKEALKRMREAKNAGDAEDQHIAGDELLCEFLRSLGHSDLVDEWIKLDKWYA